MCGIVSGRFARRNGRTAKRMKAGLEQIFNIEGSTLCIDYTFEIDECPGYPENPFISPVKVTGEIHNSTGIVCLKAKAVFDFATNCDRCASPIRRRITVPVHHDLIASLNDEDNDEYILVEDLTLDIDELVREDIFLSLPTRMLCRPDCKGLCAICGRDLNEGDCGCGKPLDPRFAALDDISEE